MRTPARLSTLALVAALLPLVPTVAEAARAPSSTGLGACIAGTGDPASCAESRERRNPAWGFVLNHAMPFGLVGFGPVTCPRPDRPGRHIAKIRAGQSKTITKAESEPE